MAWMLRRLRRDERGVAVLEMALLAPIIAFLFMFLIESGFFFFNYVSAANAVREGARCGTVGYTVTSIQDRVVEASSGLSPNFDTGAVTVVYADDDGDGIVGELGETIQVSGEYEHRQLASWPFFGDVVRIFPASYTRSATMRLEVAAADANQTGCSVGVTA